MHKYEEMEYSQIARALELLGICGKISTIPGVRNIARPLGPYGVK